MEVAASQFRSLYVRMIILGGLVIAMLAASSLLWPQVSEWQERHLAKRLVEELQYEDPAEIEIALRQIASLGNPAIDALVFAATSQRADVALAARELINEKMATWKSLQSIDENFAIAVPTGLLARALAIHVEEFGPLGQQWSSRLAVELADLAADMSPAEVVSFLADCSILLEKIPAVGPRFRTLAPNKPIMASDQVPAPVINLPALPSEYAISSKSVRPPLPTVPDDIQTENSIEPEEIANSTQLPRASDWLPEWTGKAVEANKQSTKTPEQGPKNPQLIAVAESIDVPSPDEMAARLEELNSRTTRDLLAELSTTDYFNTAAIQAVLKERGITHHELSLAKKLMASDSADRLRLVDELKVLPARTARSWLRELLSDTDAEVRLKALTALATTKDPELVGVARELAIRENDPRVSDLAARIVREAR